MTGDFPRGGAGPPQPLPRGARIGLILVSVLTLASVIAMAVWLML